jgi:iron complex transport system ATP-binding protein
LSVRLSFWFYFLKLKIKDGSMSEAVSFRDIHFGYVPKQEIISGYSANIPKKGVFAVLGPNGCGKSTLLKLLLGQLKPLSGLIEIRGQTAFVPQLFQVTFAFTALDMVLMGRAKKIGLFGKPGRQDVIAALKCMNRLGIEELVQRPFHQLSGGQRQLVILARALVSEAEILLLDEPTSALDLKNQALALKWISRLAGEDGLTVIFSTHHPHHALAVADQALLMLDRDKYICGPVRDVLTDYNLGLLYGVPIKQFKFDYNGRSLETLIPVFDI